MIEDLRESFRRVSAIAVRTNDLKAVCNLLSSPQYEQLTKYEKEREIIKFVDLDFEVFGKAKNILHYLILNYQIKEEHSLFLVGEDTKAEFSRLLKIRELNSELNSELENTDKVNRKLKV